jgi:hypothetical protein
MKYANVIIDGNCLYHQCYHGFKSENIRIKDQKELKISGIYGFLKRIKEIENELLTSNGTIYYLWDNFSSKHELRKEFEPSYIKRVSVDPGYKSNRNPESSVFYYGLELLRTILKNRNNEYYDIQIPLYEADDLVKNSIEYIRKISGNKNDRVLIYSADFDWARTLQFENVFWHNFKTIYHREEFRQKFKYYPDGNSVAIYKAIKGDASDYIQSASLFLPEDKVLKIVNDYTDIYHFIDQYDNSTYLTLKEKKRIKKHEADLRRNYNLVNFIEVPKELFENNCFKTGMDLKKVNNILSIININPLDIGIELIDIKKTKTTGFFVRR